jgi:hypothetical protein
MASSGFSFHQSVSHQFIHPQSYFISHQYKRIFLLLLILVVLAVLDNIWIAGYAWSDQFFQLGLIALLLLVVINKSINEWMHYLITGALAILTIVTLVLTWNKFVLPI